MILERMNPQDKNDGRPVIGGFASPEKSDDSNNPDGSGKKSS